VNRGQRVAESPRDPDNKIKAISGCLLLFAIAWNPGIDLVRLYKKLEKIWEKIHEKDPKFYLFWGKYSDGHSCQDRDLEGMLKLYVECKYIEAPDGFCYLTRSGLKLLIDAISKYSFAEISWAEIKKCIISDN
jgi:hypothetical protein